MVMPMCSTDEDMFENEQWDFKKVQKGCMTNYKIQPNDPLLAVKEYGGKDLRTASNIVFSNGLMDPWSSGGVLSNPSPKVYSVVLPDGAHHYDLRAENAKDTATVRDVRKFHISKIRDWINSYYKQNQTPQIKVF